MSTKQITINVFATYAQTLVSIVVGLFTVRWVFSALGKDQFGLFSVVGSIISFASIFNGVMTNTNSRFFAYAIGESRANGKEYGEQELNKWFNTSISIHLIMGIILCTIAYPLGLYLISNKLSIPIDLLDTSKIIFKISILTMFFTIMNVPFHAIYTAKQLIFVRNISNIIQTLLCAAEGWFILNYSGNRLIIHSVLTAAIIILIYSTMAFLAFYSFKECHINIHDWFNKKRLKKILSYSSFSIFGSIGNTLSGPGINLVINAFYGTTINALISIGHTISAKTNVLSDAVTRAVAPEITSRIGANDLENAKKLSLDVSFFSTALCLIILIPIMFYMQPLLVLWLKNPPLGASELTIIMLINSLVLSSTSGYMMLVHAYGKIKIYSITLGLINASSILIAYLFSKYDINHFHPLINLSISWLIPHSLLSISRIFFAKRILNLEIKMFFTHIFFPAIIIIIMNCSINYLIHKYVFTTPSIWGLGSMLSINTIINILFIIFWDIKVTKNNRVLIFYSKVKKMVKQ